MKKKIIKVLILFLYFFVCVYLIERSFKYDNVKSNYKVNTGHLFSNEKMIEIPKINLFLIVEKADDNFQNLDESLVYYKYFNPDDKIIIFGHSGMGTGTYFNKLDELNNNDMVNLYFDGKVYKYEFNKSYVVSKTATYLLENEENSKKLLLITCKRNDKNKRVVVELVLKSSKTLKK